MKAAMLWVYILCGLIVVAEALNKLERCRGLREWPRGRRAQLVEALKIAAWSLLALGGAGVLVTPLLRLTPPDLRDLFVIVGFAILIIRTRVKEG